jgi:hypothetical protein
MKSKIQLFFLLTIIASAYGQTTLIPYRQGNKWGYATRDSQLVVKAKYSEANNFYFGLARVKKGNKYGYIDETGKLFIPQKYRTASDFYDNWRINTMAGVSMKSEKETFWIDLRGKKLENFHPTIGCGGGKSILVYTGDSFNIPRIYDSYYKLQGLEYYIVTKNHKKGIVNSKKETLLPIIYDEITSQYEGAMYFTLKLDGRYGYLIKSILIQPKYLSAEIFWNGIAKVKTTNNQFGFVDEAGVEFWDWKHIK